MDSPNVFSLLVKKISKMTICEEICNQRHEMARNRKVAKSILIHYDAADALLADESIRHRIHLPLNKDDVLRFDGMAIVRSYDARDNFVLLLENEVV
jgi:hypothetical protein